MSADRWSLVVLAAVALLVWSPRDTVVLRRSRALRRVESPAPVAEPPARPAEDPMSSARRRWLFSALAGLATGVLIGGGGGVAAAAVVIVGAERLLRRGGREGERVTRAMLERNLPGACDLIGVCLSAGLPLESALAAVGEAVPRQLGAHLRNVAALYRLGADPRRVWSDVPPQLAALGRLLVRAGESGSAAVPALRALAEDSRSAARAATEAAARRAGVWVLAPLGVCFLPAFLCLGVVPLVLGIAGDVFG